MGISSYESLKARVSSDGMKAYITLLPGSAFAHYTKGQLEEFLRLNNIVYGVDEEALARIVENPQIGEEYCVAHGKEAINAQDGSLEYKFDAKPSRKPKINEDGTVDYWSMHLVEIVHIGDVIAVATDPTEPVNGTKVTGAPIPAKRGRPAPLLRGKGYKVSEDGHSYIALITGKIELVHGSVRISEIYEVKGDAGIKTGNIDFHGDVVIHGDVTPGANIKATGTITVDGICENCTIEAGKDIMLRGGVLGGHKTNIRSMGSVNAKFFEYCKVYAEGCIMAESSLDSVLESHEIITLTGKTSGLVGGVTYATEGVRASVIGNDSELHTEVMVGIKIDILRELYDAKKVKVELEGVINKINAGLKHYEEYAIEHGRDADQEERRLALFRTRMMKQADEAEADKKIAHINELIARGKGATVEVQHEIYPGVIVSIDRFVNILRNKQTAVRFELDEDGANVIMLSLRGNYI